MITEGLDSKLYFLKSGTLLKEMQCAKRKIDELEIFGAFEVIELKLFMKEKKN